jgi:hypothetical protein
MGKVPLPTGKMADFCENRKECNLFDILIAFEVPK